MGRKLPMSERMAEVERQLAVLTSNFEERLAKAIDTVMAQYEAEEMKGQPVNYSEYIPEGEKK